MTAFAMVTTGSAQAQPTTTTVAKSQSSALYMVQMSGNPLATYTGDIAGYSATKPAAGAKIDFSAANTKAYQRLLGTSRTNLLNRSGVSTKTLYNYDTTFNGFAASLTPSQVAKLRSDPDVVNVWKNTIVSTNTVSTPAFLGLDGTTGVWNKQFGDVSKAGQGIIVGDIDTGFWPESPSFAALPTPRPDQGIINAKWHGTCDPGVSNNAQAPVSCNNKVIGARWFDASQLAEANPAEFKSPRDYDGHGSHTASTAAGDHGVEAIINGGDIGSISGMAPAARIAVYKVLFEKPDNSGGSGGSIDIVAAIDQAVKDGVDILNYSVGDNVDDISPVEVSFLNAAAAGVFISAAAGNAGPGASTVDNATPWETTVAASTHDRAFSKTATLGNGVSYVGVGVGPAVASSPLVDSASLPAYGTFTAAQKELCFIGALDPAAVAGKIVLCKRGTNNRTDKSQAVKTAGGVGMILYNPTVNSLNADFHFVPTVHVGPVEGAAIKAYIAGTASPTASLALAVKTTVEAPSMAAFSSRGPSISSGGDLLKPDISAPGVDVIAAVSPMNHAGNLFDIESGTSMSTPHIAGIAALLMSKNPLWTPMMVKSAMMTTATVLDNMGNPIADGTDTPNADPLDFGSGHVVPASAFDPGLVYNSNIIDWLQYSCGLGTHISYTILGHTIDSCSIVGSKDASDFNDANIAAGDLAGTQTMTRTVMNVSTAKSVYTPTITAPAGFTVTVSPSKLTLKFLESATYKVTITRTTAPFGTYAFGALTWKDGTGSGHNHSVRSTIAVRPVEMSVPKTLTLSGTSGSSNVTVRTGFTGTYTTSVSGLAGAVETDMSLNNTGAGFDSNNPMADASTGSFLVTVPSGAKLAKFATHAADYPVGTDIDLYVYAADAGGNPVALAGVSAGGTADESVSLSASGNYRVFVNLFAEVGTGNLTVKHYGWIVNGAAGNLTVSPTSKAVTSGGSSTSTLSWSGLTAGKQYLGEVDYLDGTTVIGSIFVTVNS